jgi:cysteinyl-tRNA synthetase
MVIRFFILQTHYRSTLDFSNEALQASEKGLKRLWDAYGNLQKLDASAAGTKPDPEFDKKVSGLLNGFEESMNDDFNTAKVLANIFELVPLINSMKDRTIPPGSLSEPTFERFQKQMKVYLEDILGLKDINQADNDKLRDVMQLLIDIRKEAKSRKDFVTSDKIRNQLAQIGIALKDEKDGNMSWSIE